jgi:hypothetical protein
MPFISGRYYANALAGHAIEAAREAEAALLALKQKGAVKGSASGSDSDSDSDADQAGDEDDSWQQGERQFIAWKLRRRNWFRRTAGVPIGDLWRGCIAIRHRLAARRMGRLRRGHLCRDNCLRADTHRSLKRMCSRVMGICWIS